MQYAPVIVLICLIGIAFSQEWGLDGSYAHGDEYPDFHRYITNKRAINGQLRRSSIRWGKRTFGEQEQHLPLVPEDVMALWPAPRLPVTAAKKNSETMTETTKSPHGENSLMERVAKGGIRPKLALSSRLWGR